MLDLDGNVFVDLADSISLLHNLNLAGPASVRGNSCLAVVGCPEVCN